MPMSNQSTMSNTIWPGTYCKGNAPLKGCIVLLLILNSMHNTATDRRCYFRSTSHLPVYTLSGRIGKRVASHAAAARSSPSEVALIYTMHVALRGYCP